MVVAIVGSIVMVEVTLETEYSGTIIVDHKDIIHTDPTQYGMRVEHTGTHRGTQVDYCKDVEFALEFED